MQKKLQWHVNGIKLYHAIVQATQFKFSMKQNSQFIDLFALKIQHFCCKWNICSKSGQQTALTVPILWLMNHSCIPCKYKLQFTINLTDQFIWLNTCEQCKLNFFEFFWSCLQLDLFQKIKSFYRLLQYLGVSLNFSHRKFFF